MNDITIITQIIQLVSNYPIQTGMVLFFSLWLFGIFKLELSK